MAKLAAILDAARTLSPDERRRLIVELDALAMREDAGVPTNREPLAGLRALSGTAHSDFADISTNKYPCEVESRIAEIIELADLKVLDLARSRRVEQEVLDLLEEPITR